MASQLEPVRLVIWDLDETFWRGTLSEGGITDFVQAHHDLIVELSRRGIMNSICSKNDHGKVEAILRERGIWDYFIFPSIDWSAKGQRIAAIVEDVQLRPSTVRFIDDNPNNLAEAKSFLPEIQVADETTIAGMLDDPLFRGKNDPELRRLQQYRVLESRKTDENRLVAEGNNIEFLRSCNIRVTIDHDIGEHLDRVIELINRTNQLNFTKKRLEGDKAGESLLADIGFFVKQAGLVRVQDRYGDYGFAGFYVKHGLEYESRLEHYCFSCRILGMGVETWLYQRLGSPDLVSVGETLSNPASGAKIDWINQSGDVAAEGSRSAMRQLGPIRLVGGCDLDAVAHYLRLRTDDLVSQTNRDRGGIFFRQDSVKLATLKGTPEAELLKPLGFEDSDLRDILTCDLPPRAFLIASLSGDLTAPTFVHRDARIETPLQIDCFPFDLTQVSEEAVEEVIKDKPNRFAVQSVREAMREIRTHWEFLTEVDLPLIIAKTEAFLDRLPPHCDLALLLPATRGNQDNHFVALEWASAYCEAMTALVQNHSNVRLVGFDSCIERPSDIDDAWGGHFNRLVYSRMADLLIRVAEESGDRRRGSLNEDAAKEAVLG